MTENNEKYNNNLNDGLYYFYKICFKCLDNVDAHLPPTVTEVIALSLSTL